jgi:ditrans,polycis-polyprenyl diphosphate synthase
MCLVWNPTADRKKQILEVCYKSGVTHVTIYAFSIENFKRTKYEVDALMDMAKIKLKQFVQHGELLERYGACIRFLGQRELVKPDVLEAVDRAVELTSGNGNCVLNVCFPYTSREEIATAIREVVEEYSLPLPQSMAERDRNSPFKEERIANTIRSQQQFSPLERPTHLQAPGPQSPASSTTSLSSFYSADHASEHDTSSVSTSTTLHPDDTVSPPSEYTSLSSTPPKQTPSYPSAELITTETLNSHMYTASDPPIDLLIRTSGVSRLSDFMLWQCHEHTQIVFLDVLWPEFDLWSFLPVLWEWQWRVRKADLKRADGDEAESARTKSAHTSAKRPKRAAPTWGPAADIKLHAA